MEMSARKSVVIATVVAVICAAALIIANYTNLVIDERPPLAPRRHDIPFGEGRWRGDITHTAGIAD